MSYVFRVTPVQGVAYREFSRILDTHPALPTGFFADNDIIALDCIRALKEHGVTTKILTGDNERAGFR